MNKSCPIPTVESYWEDPSIERSIIHPHQGVGHMGRAYRGNIRYTKKGVVDVVMRRRVV